MKYYEYILTNENSGATHTLNNNPDGWDSLEETFYRHEIYNSVLYKESSNQMFVRKGLNDEGGYQFIKNAYDADGIKAKVRLDRRKLNPYSQQYVSHFTGYLDFNPKSGIKFTDDGVDVNIIDSSKLEKFLSRDELELDLFSLESVDGITISDFPVAPSTAFVFKPIDISLALQASGNFNEYASLTVPYLGFIIEKTQFAGTKIINEIGDRITIEDPTGGFTIYNNTTNQNTYLTNINFIGSGTIDYVASSTFRIALSINFEIYDSIGTLIDTLIAYRSPFVLYDNINGTGQLTYSIASPMLGGISFIEVPSGGYVNFLSSVGVGAPILGGGGNCTIDVNLTLSNLFFYEKSNGYPQSSVFGHMIHNAIERSIQLITSETDTTKLLNANILGLSGSAGGNQFRAYPSDGKYGNEFLFNGFAARQILNKSLNVSFRDLFNSMSYVDPLMLWYDKVNDYFIIDEIDQAFKMEAYSTNLGEVKNLKTYPAQDFYFNQLLTGYEKTDNEDFSGANEINTETEHSLSYEVKVKKELRGNIKRSSIDIELLRRKNVSLYASEDTKNDKQNYIVLTSGTYASQGDLSDASGFPNIEQYYNLTRTPRQNLIRWMKVLKATMFKHPTEEIKFVSSYKDSDITYTDPTTGLSVNENSNIPQTTVEKIFNPEFDEFEAVYNDEVRDAIHADPHKYWEYYDRDGNIRRGFNWEVTGNLHTQKGQFKLLRINENLL